MINVTKKLPEVYIYILLYIYIYMNKITRSLNIVKY